MANLRFFVDYFKHYFSAKSRHGTHSPFAYKLVDEVIYDFAPRHYDKAIEKQRHILHKDSRTILVNDLGAGSMHAGSGKKTIGQIARKTLKPARIGQLLARLAQYFDPSTIVELGTSFGITSAYLASASKASRVYTIEGCTNVAQVAQETFEQLRLTDRVALEQGNFDDVLPQVLEEIKVIDFLFIDGNHTYDATMRYFGQCLDHVNENSVLVFDDIYWSEGMKRAWEDIKAHTSVTLSMDLFYIGLVFFRKGREKEHFKIKFG